jgi:hypothetical protein
MRFPLRRVPDGRYSLNKITWVMVLWALGAASGCSLLVDEKVAQCQVDADCLGFHGHPYCRDNVCVPSGLGPEDCVVGTPTTQSDYINACSTSKCVPFDNCERLGLCSPNTPLPETQDPTNVTIPPLVNAIPRPTVSCNNGGANVIYMFGTADFAPLLSAAQPALSASTPPYRGVYQNASSCAGASAVFDPTKRKMKDPPMTATGGWAFYFDDSGKQVNCLIDDGTMPDGATIDIGVSDLYAQTCDPTFVPGGAVGEYLGPVVPFVLSAPATSSQQSISTEAAHFIFGRGGKAPPGSGMKDAAPWTDPTNYSIRNSTSASTVLTALLTDVPRTKFWGVDRLTVDNLRDSLLASTAISSSIGILSIDYNDKNRGNLKSLYLQTKGQSCGYQPDSSPMTYDKMNVRDGHYLLWGYVHFFTPLGAGGVPSPAAGAMVLLFRVQKLAQSLLDDVIAASLIPQCAMKVVRNTEVGDFMPQTGFQCGCYFDKLQGKTSCQTCNTADDCPSDHPACNYGYCELR